MEKLWKLRIFLAVTKAPRPLTSREVAKSIGLDYCKNFNKREAVSPGSWAGSSFAADSPIKRHPAGLPHPAK